MNSPQSNRSPNAADQGTTPHAEPADSAPQRAKILHELVRVRREAEAARLEAQASRLDAAAEKLVSLLEQIDSGETVSAAQLLAHGIPAHGLGEPTTTTAPPASPSQAIQPLVELPAAAPEPPPASHDRNDAVFDVPAGDHSRRSPLRFDSWDAIRAALTHDRPLIRQDGPHAAVRSPRMRGRARPTTYSGAGDASDAAETETGPEKEDSETSLSNSESSCENNELSEPIADFASPVSLSLSDETDPPPRRRRSFAVFASAIVHLIILLCLAGFTLTNVMPKDQVALSASTSEASQEAIETFQIETVQAVTETSESTPDDVQYELDPISEMQVIEVTPVSAAVPPPASAAAKSLTQPTADASKAMQALKPASQSKMQFCGVEGGGNHFVYLVDSSGSMGDAFISARRALLESIDMLTAEQRFYVIFFDAKCDFMRITRADQDERRSVTASDENKRRLKSWAMRVEMDRGQAPKEPLRYALQKLKPDVIFLLSDGEFPQSIEDLLQTENRVTNLFGETNPISIIHTISYHSREGERRMRRIAKSNFGQYRYVPKP